MLFGYEMTCFNSNFALKNYSKKYIFLFLAVHFVTQVSGSPYPLYEKEFSPWIWANLKNDPENIKNHGISRIRGSLTCLIHSDKHPTLIIYIGQ